MTSVARLEDTGRIALSVSQRIAEYAVSCGYGQLPPATVTDAKRLMLDTLAVAWGGADAPGSEPVYRMIAGQEGRGDSQVWARPGRIPAASAAFVNSMFGAALDYDAVNTVHADVVALPAALAVAERERISGRDFLAAYVIGSDLCCRLGGAITGQHKGWFTTSIFGVFGAAVAAAKAMKLDAEQVRHALGIALSQASGTQQANIEQALTKRLQSAFAARGGVFSADLAGHGITAPREAMEGKFGLYHLYQEGDPFRVLDGLGERFSLGNTALKKYPCCACSHAALEATLTLVKEHDLRPDDVTEIQVLHSPMMHRLVGAEFNPSENPQVTAQFSVQYAVASALLRRKMGISEIQEDAILEPAIREITRRVRVVVEETSRATRSPATVTISTKKHGRLVLRQDRFPWGPEDIPEEEALRVKFDSCMDGSRKPLSGKGRGLLVARVRNIEDVEDMSGFFSGIS
ncbi:MAG: MmgE/PrpD family protein [Burkholderiales bacterium]|nr:MmgE/PrpD family protein [Burkholderiales bacterium]